MATRVHGATEFAFAPLLTTLATNTALGTATRHDFTAITLYVPETLVGASPFRSVRVVITVRTQGTSARNLTGWRIGIKLGAVAFDDVDFTPTTISNSGENYTVRLVRDVTAYFNTNWTGASMTAQVGVAFSQNVADVVGNITAKIEIGAYDYDDTSTTYIQTARIPIQSHHVSLPTTKTEIGTGGDNPASANQIPVLDDFLPEDSVVIRRAWIEIYAADGTGANTDFNLFVEIDSAGESTRATLEAATVSECYFEDHFIYDTATYSTASAHALSLRSSLASRFPNAGAVLHVTYEFDPASTTHLQSLKLPICSRGVNHVINGTGSTDADVYAQEYWIEEPATVTLKQSALVLLVTADGAPQPTLVACEGASVFRTYTSGAGALWNVSPIVHRVDIGSDWDAVRGLNRYTWSVYCATTSNNGLNGGYLLLNYHSGKAADGKGAHARSCAWSIADFPASGASNQSREIATSGQRSPGGLATNYFWVGVMLDRMLIWGNSVSGVLQSATTSLQLLSGEYDGGGWLTFLASPHQSEEYGNHDHTFDLTPWVDRHDQTTGKVDLSTARKWRLANSLEHNGFSALALWTTHHEITFDVAGDVIGYTGDGSGIGVSIWNDTRNELITTVTSTTGGAYAAVIYDNTDTYFAEARQDSTHVGRSDTLSPT